MSGTSFLVPADSIVIDRAELPTFPPGATHVLGVDPMTAEKAREVALAHLALAEYLDAHPPTPPVDEADVETLAGLIRHDDTNGRSASVIARRLLATGKVKVSR